MLKENRVLGIVNTTIRTLETWFLPLFDLFIRFWISLIFWRSGVLKFQSWDSAVTLFTYEHPVPFLPPEGAAIFSIIFELSCPILLTFGFLTRLAVIPLITMTLVIQFTYMNIVEHYYWLMLLVYLLLKGPGVLSIDYYLRRKFLSP
ncbi:MAG: DoxX family protein [Gammaproteobacteria bacterium]|nr:DoxX family protein [Gammaproteobacteria bacterium]